MSTPSEGTGAPLADEDDWVLGEACDLGDETCEACQ